MKYLQPLTAMLVICFMLLASGFTSTAQDKSASHLANETVENAIPDIELDSAPLHTVAPAINLSKLNNAVLWENAGIKTGTVSNNGTAAPAGTQWSEVQNDSGINTVSNTLAGTNGGRTTTLFYRLADDFTVPSGQAWQIDSLIVYGYQTGYTGTASPFIDANLRIWNGDPMGVGTAPIYGDTTFNVLINSYFDNAYRTFNSNPLLPTGGTATGTTRRVWRVVLGVGELFAAGTYWLDWQTVNTALATHFTPPATLKGKRTRPGANGRQQISAGWQQTLDSGSPTGIDTVNLDLAWILYGERLTSVEPRTGVLPSEYTLDQNYPNPFNPSTTIQFGLPEAAYVSLKVYNVLGQEVISLFEGFQQAGNFDATWSGKNSSGISVPSGMYFYRLDATGANGKNFSSMQKMVLMK